MCTSYDEETSIRISELNPTVDTEPTIDAAERSLLYGCPSWCLAGDIHTGLMSRLKRGIHQWRAQLYNGLADNELNPNDLWKTEDKACSFVDKESLLKTSLSFLSASIDRNVSTAPSVTPFEEKWSWQPRCFVCCELNECSLKVHHHDHEGNVAVYYHNPFSPEGRVQLRLKKSSSDEKETSTVLADVVQQCGGYCQCCRGSPDSISIRFELLFEKELNEALHMLMTRRTPASLRKEGEAAHQCVAGATAFVRVIDDSAVSSFSSRDNPLQFLTNVSIVCRQEYTNGDFFVVGHRFTLRGCTEEPLAIILGHQSAHLLYRASRLGGMGQSCMEVYDQACYPMETVDISCSHAASNPYVFCGMPELNMLIEAIMYRVEGVDQRVKSNMCMDGKLYPLLTSVACSQMNRKLG